jgi:hypothetical protein
MIEIAEYSSNQKSYNTGLDISKVLNCNPFTSFLKLVAYFLHELKSYSSNQTLLHNTAMDTYKQWVETLICGIFARIFLFCLKASLLWRTKEVRIKAVFYDDSSKLCGKRGFPEPSEGLKTGGGKQVFLENMIRH